MALPVFKIGRCPLAGQAGFDSQALPPNLVQHANPIAEEPLCFEQREPQRGARAPPAIDVRPIVAAGAHANPDAQRLQPPAHDQPGAPGVLLRRDDNHAAQLVAHHGAGQVSGFVGRAVGLIEDGDVRAIDAETLSDSERELEATRTALAEPGEQGRGRATRALRRIAGMLYGVAGLGTIVGSVVAAVEGLSS